MGEETTGAIRVDAELNLRSEVCPYTFVKSKLALEEVESGQVIRIIVDNDESGENVPRSLADEGHQVLEVRKLNESDWAIIVRKS